MNRIDISNILDNIQPDLTQMDNQAQREAVAALLNIVEVSVAEIDKLMAEVQSLNDEVKAMFLRKKSGNRQNNRMKTRRVKKGLR